MGPPPIDPSIEPTLEHGYFESRLPFIPDIGGPMDWALTARFLTSKYLLDPSRYPGYNYMKKADKPLDIKVGPPLCVTSCVETIVNDYVSKKMVKSDQEASTGHFLKSIVERSKGRRERFEQYARDGWPSWTVEQAREVLPPEVVRPPPPPVVVNRVPEKKE